MTDFTMQKDADGVAVITWDVPGKSMNVLSLDGAAELDALIDEATRMPYYRAEVTIPADQLAKLGDLALIPGMPVEVYIQTGERSPLAYLMKPLTDYFVRAFREQ